MSFTVPLFFYYRCHCNWCDLVLFVGRLLAQWPLGSASVSASRCRVVVVLLLVVPSRFYLGQRYADDWKFFIYFQYHVFFGCVCMLNYWFSSNYDICAIYYNFRFKLKASVAVASGRCIFPVLMTSSMRTLGASACFMVGSAAVTDLHRQLQLLPGFSCRASVAVRCVRCICTAT